MRDSRRGGLEPKARPVCGQRRKVSLPHYLFPSQRPSAHYPVFPRTLGSLPTPAEPQGNRLLISTLDGLNNTIFVCKATNALGSGQGQKCILVKGEWSSDKEGRLRRVTLSSGIWVAWQTSPAQAAAGVGSL